MSFEATQVRTHKAKPKRQSKDKIYHMPPYHVILLNDDDHTYEYVIRMLGELFGHSPEKAFMSLPLTTTSLKLRLKKWARSFASSV